MNKNYSIVDNKIVPRENQQFEYGERWVMCEYCGINRPLDKMEVVTLTTRRGDGPIETEQFAACKDQDDCDTRNG